MGERTYRILHLFAGIGGGALGFQAAAAQWGGLAGRFETVVGIDCDAAACADFEALTGARAVRADLATMTPAELLAVAGDEAPDVVFASPPCKGFSGLLPKASAAGEHYQLLNRLVLQGLFLVLEAWPARPPRLILIENVPRIVSRGAVLLAQVEQLLRSYGYRFDRSTHDCGELGGLGQHRSRFLLLARHERQLPSVVYRPAKKRVRSIGEVLEQLPLPGEASAGPLHRLPRLQWKTWVRLALIPAGGDWRDLPQGEYAVVGDPGKFKGRPGLIGVAPWDEPASAVTGSASATGSNGMGAVADPRPGRVVQPFNNVYRLMRWDQPSGAVTAGGGPSSSGVCVADPRLGHEPRKGALRMIPWGEPAPTVTGAAGIGRSCSYGVADPRTSGRFHNQLRVEAWGEPAHTVTGVDHVTGGAPSVADPRLGCSPRSGAYRVQRWDEPASTVIGSADVHAGSSAVADPRIPGPDDRLDPAPVIIAEDGTWHRPLTTLELAALQDLPMRMADGSPLTLAGRSDKAWRERVGNAVPVGTARAIAEQLLETLLQADSGLWLVPQGHGEVWVEQPERAALADDRCEMDTVGHQCACDRVWCADVAEGGDWWLSRGFAGDELRPEAGGTER